MPMKYLLIFLFPLSLLAQNPLQNLKKAAAEKAKSMTSKESLGKVGNSLLNEMDKARAQFDSADFDYAILVSDNSGLFDLREKGEGAAKLSTGAGLYSSFMKNDELSDLEKARFNLEMGELWYAQRKFQYAEKRFVSARQFYEGGGLTEDIGYLKTIANQGLLYTTMGRFTHAESLQQRRWTYAKRNWEKPTLVWLPH